MILAVLFIAAGLLYVLIPETALALTGEFQLDSNALVDARASYGGFQLGLGIFLLLEWRENRPEYALKLTTILLLTVGTLRLIGYSLHPDVNELHLLAAAIEIATALFLAALVARQKNMASC